MSLKSILCLPSGLILSGFPSKTLYAFLTLVCMLQDLITSLSYIIYQVVIMCTLKCRKFPRWIMQNKQKHDIKYLVSLAKKTDMTIKFLSVNTSIKHSQCFLAQQEMFLHLSAVQGGREVGVHPPPLYFRHYSVYGWMLDMNTYLMS
jgi:hypothetical protein